MAASATQDTEFECTYKILLLGDSGVGKTCLIFRFTEDIFSDSYISTIGIDCRSKVVDIDGKRVRMQLWDTAGQERFRTLTNAYYRGAMGIVLVYDITTEDSYKHISQWLQNIAENCSSPDVCKILVGNKLDAEDERIIDKKRGFAVVENNKELQLDFFETSARTGENVHDAFIAVGRKIKEMRHQKEMRLKDIEGCVPITGEEENAQATSCC